MPALIQTPLLTSSFSFHADNKTCRDACTITLFFWQRLTAICSHAASSPQHHRKSDDYHSTVKALQSKQRTPKKWLGQHYMLSEDINRKLVQVACVDKDDIVLEIGPGTGALTACLVEAGAHVVAVEKDSAMADLVSERFSGNKRVEVIHEDFMKWHVERHMELLLKKSLSMRLAKVVSNLPFNITTPVIRRILPMGDLFSKMVLLLQDETASRLINMSPQAGEYRSMSLFVQFFSEAHYALKVNRDNFFPQPNVNAAVVSFNIKPPSAYPVVASMKSFFTLVNSAFAGKRKMLRNSLHHLYSSSVVGEALQSLGYSDSARPHELSIQQFVMLYNTLDAKQEAWLEGQSVEDMD